MSPKANCADEIVASRSPPSARARCASTVAASRRRPAIGRDQLSNSGGRGCEPMKPWRRCRKVKLPASADRRGARSRSASSSVSATTTNTAEPHQRQRLARLRSAPGGAMKRSIATRWSPTPVEARSPAGRAWPRARRCRARARRTRSADAASAAAQAPSARRRS